MENELEVVNIRLVREPSLYSEQILDSPQAVVELMAKELSQYDREVFCILNMKNNGLPFSLPWTTSYLTCKTSGIVSG